MKKFFKLMALAVLPIFAVSCAGMMKSYNLPARAAYHPKKSPEEQKIDIVACKQNASDYAGGYDPDKAATSGAIAEGLFGAALGAAVGAITGGIWGSSGSAAIGGAAIGGGGGVLHGAQGELGRMHDLYTKQYSVCVRSKGYLTE